MKSIRRILVPTDFSPSANQAFAFALLLARKAKATIHLMYDVEIPVETMTGATIIKEDLEKAKSECQQKMEELIAAHDTANIGIERVIEKSSSPARGIPYYAETHDIDLIVMGAHGHHSIKEKLMGSRAERVLRDAPCPVITVTPDEEQAPAEGIAHIAVPVDFSEESAESVRVARELADAFGAHVSLLHADISERKEEVRQKLRDRYARGAGADGTVNIFVSPEPVPKAILALAEESGADLIVMATHGRKGLKRALSGNVADEVVPKAPCPVMTIPVKKHAS